MNPRVSNLSYPANCVGAARVTQDIARYNYDTQRKDIARSIERANSDKTPSYAWPIIGVVVSALATLIVSKIKKA